MPRGNWVDRGAPLEATLARVLGHALDVAANDPRMVEQALTIRGLVEANASEVHVARHVRSVFQLVGRPEPDAPTRLALGIALWHIAKAGLVRDQAARRIQELTEKLPPERPLAERLHAAVLRAPRDGPTRAPVRKPTPAEAEAQRRRPR